MSGVPSEPGQADIGSRVAGMNFSPSPTHHPRTARRAIPSFRVPGTSLAPTAGLLGEDGGGRCQALGSNVDGRREEDGMLRAARRGSVYEVVTMDADGRWLLWMAYDSR